MGVVAIGLSLDQRRALTGARPVYCRLHGGQHLKRVVAVDQIAGEPIAPCPIGNPAGNTLLVGDRDRVLVVLDDADERELVHACPVHPLVPVAFGGCPLSRVDHCHRIAPVDLQAVRYACRMWKLCADDRRLGEYPAFRV